MANHVSARPLVEGALLAAVTTVLALLGNILPVVPLFLPVPIVLIAMRHGFRISLLTVTVVGLILAITMGPSAALVETITFGSAGLAIGLGLWRKWPITWTLVLTGVASAVATFAIFALTFYLIGINQVAEMTRALAEAISMARSLVQKNPILATPQAETQLAQMELAVDLFRRSWWAIIAAGAAFSAVFQYAVVRWTLKRMRLELPPVPSFGTWRVPAGASLFLAGGLGLQILAPQPLKNVGEGLFLLLFYLYFVAGLALGYALLRRFQMHRVAAGAVALLVGFSLGPIAALAGFVDSLLDIRLWLDSRD